MGKNVAVFVDVANIFYAAKAAGVDIDYVTLLKSAIAGRDFVRAYAYTGLDPDNENQRNFHNFLARHDYKVVSKDIRKYGDGKVKANLDIELVVDMMKTARNLDVAIVVSGDGDFAPAIRAVQEMGVRVEVVSFRGNTSSDLIDVADQFTDIVQMARVEKGSSRSGRRVADDGEDLSMTEVPDKMTEGTGTGRGRGRGTGRGRGRPGESEREPVAASASRSAGRGGAQPPPRDRRGRPADRCARRRPGGPAGREAVADRRGSTGRSRSCSGFGWSFGRGGRAGGRHRRRRRRRPRGRDRGRWHPAPPPSWRSRSRSRSRPGRWRRAGQPRPGRWTRPSGPRGPTPRSTSRMPTRTPTHRLPAPHAGLGPGRSGRSGIRRSVRRPGPVGGVDPVRHRRRGRAGRSPSTSSPSNAAAARPPGAARAIAARAIAAVVAATGRPIARPSTASATAEAVVAGSIATPTCPDGRRPEAGVTPDDRAAATTVMTVVAMADGMIGVRLRTLDPSAIVRPAAARTSPGARSHRSSRPSFGPSRRPARSRATRQRAAIVGGDRVAECG